MACWRETTLGKVVELKRGYDLPAASREAGDVPIVSSSGVTGYHSSAKVYGPGVVTGRYGTLGEVFLVEGPFWPLNTALYVRDFKGNDPRFVAALLQFLQLGQHDGAAAVPGVNRNQLHGLSVLSPDIETQRRIAAVLKAFDDLIVNNRRRVELLEEMAQAIYREWFVRFRYPGHEDATLVDSTLGPTPDGWGVRPLASIAGLDRTSIQPRHSPDELFDHYSIPAFDSGQLPVVQVGETIKSGKFVVTRPAVLVSKLNPRIARTWFVEPELDRRSVASTEFLILRPKVQYSLEFLYLLSRYAFFQERLQQLSGGTSTSHQRTNPGDFLRIEVVVPPASLANELAGVVTSQMRMARALRLENSSLAALRDLLLPRLVSGQIDVSKLDLDSVVELVA